MFNFKLILIFLLFCFTIESLSSVAPDILEVHHHVNISDLNKNSSINRLFHRRSLEPSNKIDISFAHQTREWDYSWFVLALTTPTDIGMFSFGYSHYGVSGLPETDYIDGVGPYISAYHSDESNIIALAYQPYIDEINVQFLIRHRFSKLHKISANATFLDIALSSNHFYNNNIGIRTLNLLGTDYKWSTGKKEKLPQYIGTYMIIPYHALSFMIEQDIALNYDNLHSTLVNASLTLGDSLSLYSAYRFPTNQSSKLSKYLTFGNAIQLTDMFYIDFTYQKEFHDVSDNTFYSVNIGLTLE